MRLIALLAFLALPVYAYSPEELMGERQISPPSCKDGVCTMAEDDLQFITQRGRLMEEVAQRLYRKLQTCQGGRAI